MACGLKASGVDYRVSTGQLPVVHRGVYVVGRAPLSRSGRWLAAVLACGPRAALSHRDAGVLWAMRRRGSAFVEVTVPTRAGRSARPGIRIHRSALDPLDVVQELGIPVTTPARTLLDLAEVLPARAVERAIDEAERLRLLTCARSRPPWSEAPVGPGPMRCEPSSTATSRAQPSRAAFSRSGSCVCAGRAPSRSRKSTRAWRATRSTSCGRRDASSSKWMVTRRTEPARHSNVTGLATSSSASPASRCCGSRTGRSRKGRRGWPLR